MDKLIDIKNGILFFNNKKINIIIDKNNNVWYNSLDICNVLNYKDPKDAIKRHVENIDKKQLKNISTIFKNKKHPNAIYLSESGLYSLLLGSTMKVGKDFKKWIIYDVIPSIRKYGKYELIKKYKDKIKKINQLVNELKNENENIKNNIKHEKYPTGGLIYVIKTKLDGIYKIGITNNMNKRKWTYNTCIPNNAEILYFKKINCPVKIELCVKSMLYDFRYSNKREFYDCNPELIKKTINKCIKMTNDNNLCVQEGGYDYYIDKLNKHLNIYTTELSSNYF